MSINDDYDHFYAVDFALARFLRYSNLRRFQIGTCNRRVLSCRFPGLLDAERNVRYNSATERRNSRSVSSAVTWAIAIGCDTCIQLERTRELNATR